MGSFVSARTSILSLMAAIFAFFALIGGSFAADAPAPAPASAAAGIYPSFYAALLVSLAAFFLRSFFH